MKTLNFTVLSLVLLAGFTAASDADARGGRGGYHHRGGARVGVFIGAPLFPYYYGYPRYYYPPAVIAPSAPPVYVEQGVVGDPAVAGAPPAAQTPYWYFCQDSQTYYPYVQQCASQWQQVIPQASTTPQ